MPVDWRNLTVTAGFTLVVGVIIERLRTRMTKTEMEQEVRDQLIAEVIQGVFLLYGLRPVLAKAQSSNAHESKNSWAVVIRLVTRAKSDRFTYYRDTQKAIVYRFDMSGDLEKYHRDVSNAQQAISEKKADSDRQVRIAIVEGNAFLKKNNVNLKIDPKTFENEFEKLQDPRNAQLVDDIYDNLIDPKV